MNPFTQSTVAKPLPKNQRHHHYWSRPWQSSGPEQASEDEDRHPPRHTNSKENTASSIRARAVGLGLGAALLLPSAFTVIPAPAVVTGTVALVAALTPITAHAVDLNRASEQELRGVRGIGPKTAKMIVEERKRGGAFESISDLSDRVKGIGPKKASALVAAGLVVQAAAPDAASGGAEGKPAVASSSKNQRAPR